VENKSKTYVLLYFMSSGLLLNSLFEVENEFSTFCTTAGIQCFYQYDRASRGPCGKCIPRFLAGL